MEQRGLERARPSNESRARTEASDRAPGRARIHEAASAALALLEGARMPDLPASRLGELAAAVGNSNMEAIFASRSRPPELWEFSMPRAGTEPEALEAGTDPPALADSGWLSGALGAAGTAGAAFDPAGLYTGGGGEALAPLV